MPFKKRGSFNLDKSLQKFKGKKKTMPKILANIALNHFKLSFRKGGFDDNGLVKWKVRRKRLSRKRTSSTETEPATLVKSGVLRRAMQVLEATFEVIKVGTKGVRYAQRHNLGITDRLGRKMPKRPIMADSRNLDKKIEKRILKAIDEVFK